MIRTIVLLAAFTAALSSFSCGNPSSPVRDSRTLYTNQGFAIEGRDAGLSAGMRRVYLFSFNDYTGVSNGYRPGELFDSLLRDNLQVLGVTIVGRISTARAVITGRLAGLSAVPSETVTNTGGLLYTLTVTYSLSDADSRFIQQDRLIREDVLVWDTNRYLDKDALAFLLTNAARHLTEAVYYGWQLDFSKTTNSVPSLGGNLETADDTNGR